ncbi:MAG: RimK family alpha-L-glutamate ligase [Deltaproteobacteria bacterium]|nr:RimK family alpha-L-glutamate ligase [Deltaproteobacteria bacterium]
MLIGILSLGPKLYTTRRLVEAGRKLSHKVRIINTLACDLYVERGKPTIAYRGKPLKVPDVILPRIGASITQYGLTVVNQFDMMDVPVVNNSVPIARARDKLRSLQLLARFDLDVPKTLITRRGDDLDSCVERLGGYPVIMKILQGTQGVGVMIAQSRTEAASVLDAMWELGQDIMLQEFIRESKGKDVRALVVGDQVVAAMSRVAQRGEFRSNIHRGAKGKALKLDAAYTEAAIKAARVMGLEIAGVDLLLGKHGPKLMEVNSSPGLEGLEAATGRDIATDMMAHVVAFAEARQRGWQKQRLI